MFCFHKWGKWGESLFCTQYKTCEKCGLVRSTEYYYIIKAIAFGIIVFMSFMAMMIAVAAHAQDSDSNSSMGYPETDGTVTVTEYGE